MINIFDKICPLDVGDHSSGFVSFWLAWPNLIENLDFLNCKGREKQKKPTHNEYEEASATLDQMRPSHLVKRPFLSQHYGPKNITYITYTNLTLSKCISNENCGGGLGGQFII
jgi:hypothetical protein